MDVFHGDEEDISRIIMDEIIELVRVYLFAKGKEKLLAFVFDLG